ncbi:MAG: glutamate carboxypeptidase, partial [Halieaceae bacterium]
MKIVRIFIGAVLLFSTALAVSEQFNEKEQAIVQWVDAHVDESIDLLEKSVNINSGTMNHRGVRAVGAQLSTEFDALGFETQWVDLPPELNRAGHLFARQSGTKGRKILL